MNKPNEYYERTTAVELNSLKNWLKWLNEYVDENSIEPNASGTLEAIANEIALIIERAGD